MNLEIASESEIVVVPQVLTSSELDLLTLFQLNRSTLDGLVAPTGDLDQDRLLYEFARRPRLLDTVERTTGPDIALWRHSLGAASDATSSVGEVLDGRPVTSITAVCPPTEAIMVRMFVGYQSMPARSTALDAATDASGGGIQAAEFLARVPEVEPGSIWRAVQLHGGDAVVLPLAIRWFVEAGSTARILLQSFAGTSQSNPGPMRSSAFAVRSQQRSAFAFAMQRPPPKSARQSNAVVASVLPLTGAGEILLGRSDVLNAVAVSVVTDAAVDGGRSSALAESLLVALEDIQLGGGRSLGAGEALYSPLGKSMAFDLTPHAPGRALRLDWIGAPQGYAGVLQAGRPPSRSAAGSTTYLSKLGVDRAVLAPGERPVLPRSPGDVFAVLVDGALSVAGSKVTSPALLIIPAGGGLEVECAAGANAVLTIVELTGQLRQLARTAAPQVNVSSRDAVDEAPLVYFCIPLIAKSRAGNWSSICMHLDATIRSIYAQTDPSWRIIVAGNDAPFLTAELDERYTFIPATGWGDVSDLAGMNRDAAHKRLVAGAEVLVRGGGFVMQTDADDLIERTLVEFVRRNKHPYGYVVGRGIVFDFARQRASAVPFSGGPDVIFDQFCATCCVLWLPAAGSPDAQMLLDTLWIGHDQLREQFYLAGRPLMPIPFPAAAYLRFTGQNTSVDNRNDPQKWLVKAMARSLLALDDDLVSDFSLAPLLRPPIRPSEAASYFLAFKRATLDLARRLARALRALRKI